VHSLSPKQVIEFLREFYQKYEGQFFLSLDRVSNAGQIRASEELEK
jgi:hypothetical protein